MPFDSFASVYVLKGTYYYSHKLDNQPCEIRAVYISEQFFAKEPLYMNIMSLTKCILTHRVNVQWKYQNMWSCILSSKSSKVKCVWYFQQSYVSGLTQTESPKKNNLAFHLESWWIHIIKITFHKNDQNTNIYTLIENRAN